MKKDSDLMAPSASPSQMTAKKMGVRRVNNMPMYILLTVVCAFVVVMILVAKDRSDQQYNVGSDTQEVAGNTSLFAKEIAGDHQEGFIAPEVLEIPVEEPILVARPDLDTPPVPPSQAALAPPVMDPDMQRIHMAKMQMLEQAVKARTGVSVVAPRSAGSSQVSARRPETREEMLAELARVRQSLNANGSNDTTASYQAKLAQIKAMNGESAGGGGSGVGGSSSLLRRASSSGSNNAYGQFEGNGGEDRWFLGSDVEAPRSPYEIRAGYVLPATLISGVNSDLPGQIIAQVSQSVFDTPTGRHMLIPQGSRLVGSYSSNVQYGQGRVLIAWQRIIFPDGKALDIGSMPGADMAGYSGFKDQVNNHYFRIFSSAVLMSGVTAGVTLSQNDGSSDSDGQRASDALSEALGQQLGQVTAQMIAKNMNIAPTLEIRPGYRFNVIVTKDMTFSKPYKSFDY